MFDMYLILWFRLVVYMYQTICILNRFRAINYINKICISFLIELIPLSIVVLCNVTHSHRSK